MKAYRKLRVGRMCVQVAVTVAITVVVALGISCFLERMQIFEAVASCAAMWLALWAAVTLIFGRVYCSTVCPTGVLMDAVSMIFSKRRRHYSYSSPRPLVRVSVLMIVVICAICGFVFVPDAMNPYRAYSRIVVACARPMAVGLAGLLVAAVTLALIAWVAAKRGRLICNTVCPVGTILGTVSRNALFHPDVDTDLCVNCGRCADVCPSECIDLTSHVVDASRCVVCFDCMDACPAGAITYRRGRHQLSLPMMQRVAGMSGMSPFDAPAANPSTVDDMRQVREKCDRCGLHCRKQDNEH